MKRLAVAAVALALVAGCASEAKKIDTEVDAWTRTLPAAGADYGTYPTNYEALIRANLAETLKDPYSAQYSKFTMPRKEYVITNANQKIATHGYSACATVNAKNAYGAYTGNHVHWFFIRNGKIERSHDTTAGSFGRVISRNHFVNCDNG